MGKENQFVPFLRNLTPFNSDEQNAPDSNQTENAPDYENSDFEYVYQFSILVYEQFKWDTSNKQKPSYAGITKPMLLAYARQTGKMSEKEVDKLFTNVTPKSEPIPESTVPDFYLTMYWNEYHLDQLPKKTSLLLFDWLINSPGVTPIKEIQSELNLDPDGHIGPLTIKVLQEKGDNSAFLDTFWQARYDFLKTRPNAKDNSGWFDRMGAIKAYMNDMSLDEVKSKKNTFYPTANQGGQKAKKALKKSRTKTHKTSSCKICIFYASADLYDLGPGVFPADHGPDYPFHPNCHCGLEPVSDSDIDDAESGGFDPAGGEEYLKSLSEEDRCELLGKKGAAAFEEDPSSWQSYLRGYSEPAAQNCAIPDRILFEPEEEG